MKEDLKSLSLAILLSFIAIYTVNYFFGINKKSTVQTQMAEIEQAAEKLNQVTAEKPVQKVLKTAPEVLNEDARVNFSNDALKGSIRLKGARFDDLYLTKYNVSLDDVGKAGLYLASDLSTGTTGHILYVDCGCHSVYASLDEMEIIANSIPKA